MRILILGGTTEASALAKRLEGDPRFAPTLSLAGRTKAPATPGIAVRIGGFGGAEGLAQWLAQSKTEAVIDATHPFAAQISANANAATIQAGIPLCTVIRPPWQPVAGDRWQTVKTVEDAADSLGKTPRRVFLSIGRQTIGAFTRAPHHTYLARLIEPPDTAPLPPLLTLLQHRGPFDLASEIALLRSERIDVVVSKNSGGSATYAKIEAARTLGLPVIMIARPHKANPAVVRDAEEALDWLIRHHADASRSERGV
ncbi:cobalt-precorrin-6A reductase [Hyphomicrobium zavarzinii]|uniref:cobalt-precorrin-6A reductase n=1 Tax=Hyphomicrobium zavarzinii TaxID=48292 RepID=UPI0003639EC2|nr:cobalt-precorrin-6A reductase [Hyphomicrobium zavarzinii]